MTSSNDLIPLDPPRSHRIPIARLRSLYRVDDVNRRLAKLPRQEHENLRSTYERMIEKGPERFQVKPGSLPAMDHLYDELPNFHDALDDVKRQIALCQHADRVRLPREGRYGAVEERSPACRHRVTTAQGFVA